MAPWHKRSQCIFWCRYRRVDDGSVRKKFLELEVLSARVCCHWDMTWYWCKRNGKKIKTANREQFLIKKLTTLVTPVLSLLIIINLHIFMYWLKTIICQYLCKLHNITTRYTRTIFLRYLATSNHEFSFRFTQYLVGMDS